jgi:hypothetical protein
MRNIAFSLVDEVFDDGDFLLVRNNNQEERIPLSDIYEVSDLPLNTPITLHLENPGALVQKSSSCR